VSDQDTKQNKKPPGPQPPKSDEPPDRQPPKSDDPPDRQPPKHAYIEAMSLSTRSSNARNGSLHSTVRCAWSLSLRWTQSTV
jgi:hypothetical protein